MKYPFIFSGVVCLSFMLLPNCAPPPEQQAEPVAQEAPNTEADVKSIKAVNEKFLAAWNADDLDILVALLDDEAVIMPPGEPAVIGKQACEAWIASSKEAFSSEHIWSSDEIVVSADWAFSRGTSAGTNTPKAGGDPIQIDGKYIWLMKRQSDGSWKYARCIFNWNNAPEQTRHLERNGV